MVIKHSNECPVCNRVDPDRLEACADCYNGVWARATRWEQRALRAEARLEAALDEVQRLRGHGEVEYRKTSTVIRTAWFRYRDGNATRSVTDFVAGWNACMAFEFEKDV